MSKENSTIGSVMELLEHLQSMEHARSKKSDDNMPPWYGRDRVMWFRGQAQFNWPLIPGSQRRKFVKRANTTDRLASNPRISLEKSILKQFRFQGAHHIPMEASDSAGFYFYAQHYGLPTRLLDWSANPLIGLYFSVEMHPTKDAALISSNAGITDDTGALVVTMKYLKSRALWSKQVVTAKISGGAGTEYKEEISFVLPILAADISSADSEVPNRYSPYGQAGACTDPN